MVMTPLYNRAMPLIRYDLGDFVTRGERSPSERFDSIERVEGRSNDALPIRLSDGTADSLHPIVLSEFFVRGATKFQFVEERTGKLRLRYKGEAGRDRAVADEFERLLRMQGAANANSVQVERVEELPVDAKTGKYRLVILRPAGAE